jgi:hypothetical protein
VPGTERGTVAKKRHRNRTEKAHAPPEIVVGIAIV